MEKELDIEIMKEFNSLLDPNRTENGDVFDAILEMSKKYSEDSISIAWVDDFSYSNSLVVFISYNNKKNVRIYFLEQHSKDVVQINLSSERKKIFLNKLKNIIG